MKNLSEKVTVLIFAVLYLGPPFAVLAALALALLGGVYGGLLFLLSPK